MVAIVGNSPSSGSGLLAELLDSTPYGACGVELNLFSNKKLYDFASFKKDMHQHSMSSGIHRFRNGINFHRLHSYGLNEKELKRIVDGSETLHDFVGHFKSRFFALRGKSTDAVWFEKTPENVNCIKEFLTTFEDGFFIHLVRNPLYIYPSMTKRKFPAMISLLTWYFDIAKFIKYKDHPRVIQIHYEDMVSDPFAVAKKIFDEIIDLPQVTVQQIEEGYKTNRYRAEFSPKVKTWNVNEYGVIKNANKKPLDEQVLRDSAALLNVKVSKEYTRLFDMAEVSFVEAIKTMGYYHDVMSVLKPLYSKDSFPRKTVEDYSRLLIKWAMDVKCFDTNIFQMNTYLNPICRHTFGEVSVREE